MRHTRAASRQSLTDLPLTRPIPATRFKLGCRLCNNIPRNLTLIKLSTTAPSLHLTIPKSWEHLFMIHPSTSQLLLSVCPTLKLAKPLVLVTSNCSSNSRITRLRRTPLKIHPKPRPHLSCHKSRTNSSSSNNSTKPLTPIPPMLNNPHPHTNPHQFLAQLSHSTHPTRPLPPLQRVSIRPTSRREEQPAQIPLRSTGR